MFLLSVDQGYPCYILNFLIIQFHLYLFFMSLLIYQLIRDSPAIFFIFYLSRVQLYIFFISLFIQDSPLYILHVSIYPGFASTYSSCLYLSKDSPLYILHISIYPGMISIYSSCLYLSRVHL